MSEKENIVITGMARTPMGAFQGTLKDASCAELGAASIEAAPSSAQLASLSVPWKAPIGVLAIPVMTMFSFSLMKFPFLNLGKRNWANFPLRAQTGIPEV